MQCNRETKGKEEKKIQQKMQSSVNTRERTHSELLGYTSRERKLARRIDHHHCESSKIEDLTVQVERECIAKGIRG